jgi:hypothetical protein
MRIASRNGWRCLSQGFPPYLDPKLESQSVAAKARFLGDCALLCALAGGLSIPRFSLCMTAQTQAARPSMPAGLTIVPYVYKGQSFEIRLLGASSSWWQRTGCLLRPAG